QAALSGSDSDTQRRKHRCPPKGSFGDVCLSYYASPTFKRLDPSTQSWRRRALDRICEEHGEKPIGSMEPKHIRRLRDQLAKFPGASRNRLKALKALFRWAVEVGEAPHDLTRDVQLISYM